MEKHLHLRNLIEAMIHHLQRVYRAHIESIMHDII